MRWLGLGMLQQNARYGERGLQGEGFVREGHGIEQNRAESGQISRVVPVLVPVSSSRRETTGWARGVGDYGRGAACGDGRDGPARWLVLCCTLRAARGGAAAVSQGGLGRWAG